jgi:Domain of unknown function (DUF1996)
VPPAGAVVKVPEFQAACLVSHTKMDDPIVRPGLPGAFHSHEFFGNRSTDAFSTAKSLRKFTKTSCFPKSDRSAYWVPTLYDKGKRVAADEITVYYQAEEKLAPRVKPFPAGLKMIAGDGEATKPNPAAPGQWSCQGAGVKADPTMVTCPPGSKLEFILNFPDCWNGRDLDSRDHKRHMASSEAGKCPKGHPVPVPRLQFKITFPLRGGPRVTLASGKPFTLHGDFINAWDQRALKKRVDKCLRRSVKCDTDGLPV